MRVLRYLLILIIATIIFAEDVNKIKAEIIENISMLYIKKHPIYIFINSNYFNKTKKYLQKNYYFKFVNNCHKANICFVDNYPKNIKGKTIFLTSYFSYLKHKNAAGAFFWQKGRPTIIFNKHFIITHHIKIPKEYEDFVE